jgi:signal transduction histidine kinase
MRTRLAVLYAIALFVALAVTGVVVLWQQERIGLRRVDRELDTLATTLANSLREELAESHNPARAAREVQSIVATGNHSIALVDRRGVILAARGQGPPLAAAEVAASTGLGTVSTPSGVWRVRRRLEGDGDTAIALLVATPLSDVQRERREAREAMVIGIPIVFLLAAGGGLYLSSISVRPVATALEAQRRFTADAAHELRTPVSVIRSAADVTLTRDHRDEAEYREALGIISRQAIGLGRLVENMLVLARADGGPYPLRPVNLYLDELVLECRRALDALAHERGVEVLADRFAETPFRGDEDLLRQLVLNVLQNGVQHTPRGGRVGLELCTTADRVVLRVSNSGAAIPVDDQSRIFERFVQLDTSRRSEGAGLGLAIARWIARMHRGDVFLEHSDQVQTTFCISLPAAGLA